MVQKKVWGKKFWGDAWFARVCIVTSPVTISTWEFTRIVDAHCLFGMCMCGAGWVPLMRQLRLLRRKHSEIFAQGMRELLCSIQRCCVFSINFRPYSVIVLHFFRQRPFLGLPPRIFSWQDELSTRKTHAPAFIWCSIRVWWHSIAIAHVSNVRSPTSPIL